MSQLDVFGDVDMTALTERLALARRRAGLTQATVALCADLSTSHYCELESGKQPGMRLNTLYKLCQVLHVSSDYLLGLSTSPPCPGDAHA